MQLERWRLRQQTRYFRKIEDGKSSGNFRLVLFDVFFWTFVWGIAGAFIGVPIVIAAVTLCQQHPSSRWIADLLAGPGGEQT
jgi:hypothetical protein